MYVDLTASKNSCQTFQWKLGSISMNKRGGSRQAGKQRACYLLDFPCCPPDLCRVPLKFHTQRSQVTPLTIPYQKWSLFAWIPVWCFNWGRVKKSYLDYLGFCSLMSWRNCAAPELSFQNIKMIQSMLYCLSCHRLWKKIESRWGSWVLSMFYRWSNYAWVKFCAQLRYHQSQ